MENDWAVGSRYEVQQECLLSDTPDLGSKTLLDLKPRDEILLLSIRDGTPKTGFVMPSVLNGPHGWISLDEKRIWPQRLPTSWQIGGRYCTKHPCKLRAGKSIHSPDICLLECGLEVLFLEMAVDVDQDEKKVRLRAHIHLVDSAMFGWVTPEPSVGSRLLEPFNLLGPELVQRHNSALRRKEKLCQSITEQSESPWKKGCQYRVLEEQPLRELCQLTSKLTGKVVAGTVVEILDCASIPNDYGYGPSVRIRSVDEVGEEGWLRCVAKDGHKLIDSRDQLGPAKATQLLNEQCSDEQLQQQVSDEKSDGSHSMQEERSDTGEVGERPGAHVEVDEDASGSNSKKKDSGESSLDSGSEPPDDLQQEPPLFDAEPLGLEDDPADLSKHGPSPQANTVIEDEKYPFCAICVCQRSHRAKLIERL